MSWSRSCPLPLVLPCSAGSGTAPRARLADSWADCKVQFANCYASLPQCTNRAQRTRVSLSAFMSHTHTPIHYSTTAVLQQRSSTLRNPMMNPARLSGTHRLRRNRKALWLWCLNPKVHGKGNPRLHLEFAGEWKVGRKREYAMRHAAWEANQRAWRRWDCQVSVRC